MTVEAKKPKKPQKTLKDQLTPIMPNGEQNLYIFCEEEGYDSPGEYMAAHGIFEGAETRQEALIEANRIAIEDLSTRFVGIVNNAVSNYNKSINAGGKKHKEGIREGLATSVAQAAVNKYGSVACRKFSQASDGSYVGYVALHFLESDMKRAVTEELERQKVEFDRDRFAKSMQEQLENYNSQEANQNPYEE